LGRVIYLDILQKSMHLIIEIQGQCSYSIYIFGFGFQESFSCHIYCNRVIFSIFTFMESLGGNRICSGSTLVSVATVIKTLNHNKWKLYVFQFRRLEPEEYLSRKALAKQTRPLIRPDLSTSTEGVSYQTINGIDTDMSALERTSVDSEDGDSIVGDTKVNDTSFMTVFISPVRIYSSLDYDREVPRLSSQRPTPTSM
jgi:hypothetical protein